MRALMGGRYLVLAWDAAGPQAFPDHVCALVASSAAWALAHAAPGLAIWTAGDGAVAVTPRPDLGAVLIGRLAVREGAPPRAGADVTVTGRSLVTQAWGGYVALLWDAPARRWWALRDPSGALDALTWRRETLAGLASDIDDLPLGLAPRDLALDWDRVADVLRRPASLTAASPLSGLHTIAPGDLQPLGEAAGAVALWRPAAVARGDDPGPIEAGRRLAASVDLAAPGLAAPYARCVAEVSGGLDSAIVATTLARGGCAPKLAALLNFHGDRPESDERAWAALVAGEVRAPLRITPKILAPLVMEDFSDLARGARPALNALDPGRDRQTAALAGELGAAAIVTGKGGDAIFFQTPTAALLSDHVRACGPAAIAGPFAQGLARWLRRSVWSVAGEALGVGHRAGGETTPELWGPRTREPGRGVAHPWLAGLEGLPPARRYQIEAVTLAQVHRCATRHGRVATVLHPLLSQPVLEAGLSIPTWRLVAGGRDRGLARQVFADRLPPAIVARRSKGELSAFYSRLVAISLDLLRPLLIDGCLADAGVLDRAALYAALQPDALIWRADVNTILAAAALEAWVRYWQGRVGDRASAPRRRPSWDL